MKYLLAILALFVVVWLMPQPTPYRLEIAPGGEKRIAERMRYHGVKSAVCDQSACWFLRNGKRIKL